MHKLSGLERITAVLSWKSRTGFPHLSGRSAIGSAMPCFPEAAPLILQRKPGLTGLWCMRIRRSPRLMSTATVTNGGLPMPLTDEDYPTSVGYPLKDIPQEAAIEDISLRRYPIRRPTGDSRVSGKLSVVSREKRRFFSACVTLFHFHAICAAWKT